MVLFLAFSIAIFGFCCANAYRLVSRSTVFRLKAVDEKSEPDAVSYYKGLVTDPIDSPYSSVVNGKKRDNLTPNLTFVSIMSAIIVGLVAAFIVANKDTPPPPF